jgi:creatinine amidohydrolase
MGHACEWETSMMLRLHPQWVKNHAQTGSVGFGNPFEPASRGWTMPDRSAEGHVGQPSLASAEKGEALLGCFAQGVVELVNRMLAWDGSAWEG